METAALRAQLLSVSTPVKEKNDLKPELLWINLSQQLEMGSELVERLGRFCEIRHSVRHSSSAVESPQAGSTSTPDVLVFEYDYPDIDSLNILRKTRQQHPHIPIVMFTLHHSEELAIWALRNGVWDYYYKPLNSRQINDIGLSLQQWFRNHISSKKAAETGVCFLGNGYPDEVRFKQSVEESFQTQLAMNYVEQHLAEKISEDNLAKMYGISRFQFSRKFKKATNTTFQNFVFLCRVEKAKILLKNPRAQVADVAFAVGFNDPAYFARIFKRETGMLPSEYKPG